MSTVTRFVCESCKKEAAGEDQLRKENWIEVDGNGFAGVQVWLDKPRNKNGGFMHSIGWQGKERHFCSEKCFLVALRAKVSVP